MKIPNGDLRSVNANGNLLFLTPDYEDRYTRFDFNTGPGQGTVYATSSITGWGRASSATAPTVTTTASLLTALPPATPCSTTATAAAWPSRQG